MKKKNPKSRPADAPSFDAFLEKMEETIEEHGFMVILTGKEIPQGMLGMFYTVGLHEKGLPEIITFGLPREHANSFINKAAAHLMEGKLPLDVPIEKIANIPMMFKTVDPENGEGFLNVANSRAGKNVPAIQMIWSDESGLFPWDSNFNVQLLPMQPLLQTSPTQPEMNTTPSRARKLH